MTCLTSGILQYNNTKYYLKEGAKPAFWTAYKVVLTAFSATESPLLNNIVLFSYILVHDICTDFVVWNNQTKNTEPNVATAVYIRIMYNKKFLLVSTDFNPWAFWSFLNKKSAKMVFIQTFPYYSTGML